MTFKDRRRRWRKRVRRYCYGTLRRPAEVITSLEGPLEPRPLVTNEHGYPAYADGDGGSPG
jgi:hypothetical protein